MPDYYRGTLCDPSTDGDKVPGFLKEHTQWKPLKEDWEQKIRPFAENKGAQVYGTIGKYIKNFDTQFINIFI